MLNFRLLNAKITLLNITQNPAFVFAGNGVMRLTVKGNSTMQDETWKDIPEYDGMYQVSNLGRVKSFKRYPQGKMLKPVPTVQGYLLVRPMQNYRGSYRPIHRLVWIAFVGNVPSGMQINHINGVKDDNRLENLELVTPKENMKHAVELGLCENRDTDHRMRRGKPKLTPEQVLEIRENPKGKLQSEIAAELGMDVGYINKLINGKYWRNLKGKV